MGDLMDKHQLMENHHHHLRRENNSPLLHCAQYPKAAGAGAGCGPGGTGEIPAQVLMISHPQTGEQGDFVLWCFITVHTTEMFVQLN